MTNFKEALLAELTEQATAPEPVRRPVRRWAVAATGAAAAIAAAATVLVVAPQQQEPAFALTEQPDGTFVLKWSDFAPDRFEEANRVMREAGVRARMYHVGEYGACPGYDLRRLKHYRGPLSGVSVTVNGDENKFVVPRMPHDVTVLWLVSDNPRRSMARSVGTAYVAGPVPPCIQEVAPWPGPRTGSPSPSPGTPSPLPTGSPSESSSPSAD